MTQSTKGFRLMGLPLSPYTKKVQSYFDFKGIGYEWIQRSMKNEPLFQQHAKVQLIPLLFLPDGETMQDSTPIIERLEQEFPQPSVHPEDRTLWFLSCLFEEFGDEWCNKLMFFHRWMRPLLDAGHVEIVRPPWGEVVPADGTPPQHACSDAEFQAVSDAVRACGPATARRFRGLAAIEPQLLLETCIAPATRRTDRISTAEAAAMIEVFGSLDDAT
jgi:glutathione S-transferase